MTQAKIYFLKLSNNVEADGPFTLEELKTKGLAPDTPVYTNSIGEWKKATSYAELLPIILLTEKNDHEDIGQEESSSALDKSVPDLRESLREEVLQDELDEHTKREEEAEVNVSESKDAKAQSTINEDVAASSNLSFWQAYMRCWRNFGDFSGRARRLEYWSFYLMLLVAVVFFFVGMVIASDDNPLSLMFSVASILYILAAFVPSLSSQVRRLHDSGLSGWNLLWAGVPYIGGIIMLILTLRDSEKGSNKWGPNPKGE